MNALAPTAASTAPPIAAAPAPQRVYLVLWSLFPLLVPFYLFGRDPVLHAAAYVQQLLGRVPLKVESGVPQLADFLMAGLMGLIFLGLGFRFYARTIPILKLALLFILYVICVNVSWSFFIYDPDFALLKSTVFYVYDFLLLIAICVLHSHFRDRWLRCTLYAVTASVLLQALLSPLAIDRSQYRQSLFFNNFNQLGYFAVLTATLFAVGTRHFHVPTPLQVAFYGATAYFAILSLSKAAIFALALLVLFALIKRPLALAAAGVAIVLAFVAADVVPEVSERLEQRLGAPDPDDSLARRGYDRIMHHPEDLVFGAGEGVYSRFVSEHPGEMHSTLGNLLFSYGILGLGLFLAMILALVRHVGFGDAVFLLPPLLYGLAHQGLRFTLFWVLLGFLCGLGNRARVSSVVPEAAEPVRSRARQAVPAACAN